MRISVIGDSISSRNNGASAVSWPHLLETMIRDGGVFDIEVRNYSIPGLRWRTAYEPTERWKIAGEISPVDAVNRDGCGLLLVCLGVNDRQNPQAVEDALAFRGRLTAPVHYVRQRMFDASDPDESVVTADEWAHMERVYSALGGPGFYANLRALFDCGYDFDKLHPTDTGKQWIASSVYMYLQQFLPITPINRNIWWLAHMKETSPEVFEQMRRVPE